jgi:hypothetical protein
MAAGVQFECACGFLLVFGQAGLLGGLLGALVSDAVPDITITRSGLFAEERLARN